jgi:hypothetical protein
MTTAQTDELIKLVHREAILTRELVAITRARLALAEPKRSGRKPQAAPHLRVVK